MEILIEIKCFQVEDNVSIFMNNMTVWLGVFHGKTDLGVLCISIILHHLHVLKTAKPFIRKARFPSESLSKAPPVAVKSHLIERQRDRGEGKPERETWERDCKKKRESQGDENNKV